MQYPPDYSPEKSIQIDMIIGRYGKAVSKRLVDNFVIAAYTYYMYAKEEMDYETRYLKIFQVIETETELPIQGQVKDPADLYTFFKDLENEQVPKMIAIYLDSEFLFLGHQVFFATAETFDTSLLYHFFSLFLAKHFILLSNHPSGECYPTDADEKLMRSLLVDSQALSFKPCFSDYLIVGGENYFSMAINQATVRTSEHVHDLPKK